MDNIYLTITELSKRIKYSKQSIYNLIYKKTFIQQKHYFKPTPKKLLFKWEAIKEWVEREDPTTVNLEDISTSVKNSINI